MRQRQRGRRYRGGVWVGYLRVSPATVHVRPGRCAGRLGGRLPGSLDLPAHLSAPVGVFALAGGVFDLGYLSGTDD
jgi:hypothetical protein